jgi:hypothetical protein
VLYRSIDGLQSERGRRQLPDPPYKGTGIFVRRFETGIGDSPDLIRCHWQELSHLQQAVIIL